MKILKIIAFLGVITLFTSCEIVLETNFNSQGGGTYSLGFDLSEMMKMELNSEEESDNQQIDTLLVFADFIEMKWDSISKLSKEEQEKIKELEPFSLYMKSDTVTSTLEMKLNYAFSDQADLQAFGEKLKGQKFKELDMFSGALQKDLKSAQGEEEADAGDKSLFPDFNDSFITTFSREGFTLRLSPEALERQEKEKDSTLTPDSPMVDMVRFKNRYTFPYKIKSINNKNARVLSDFKGVEISGNFYEITHDPKFFDMEVVFE
ncbi:hypothetical protein [Arenibacter amylolyticus]|uniref:hypothetical protein n=1 Tax=Arenibacter amylolyticus TaxID=1406873 RepID=UPI001122692C|nr:hypothetical protein [Arenibacter amylolyticus]